MTNQNLSDLLLEDMKERKEMFISDLKELQLKHKVVINPKPYISEDGAIKATIDFIPLSPLEKFQGE